MKVNTYRATRTIVHSFGKLQKNHTIDLDEQTAAPLEDKGQLKKVTFAEGALVVTELEEIEQLDSNPTETDFIQMIDVEDVLVAEQPEFETAMDADEEKPEPKPKPKKAKGKK